MEPGQGLTALSTDELKRLLSYLHKGQLECPINAHRVACVGFQHKHAELMYALRNLDDEAVRAVLVCVLAERKHNEAIGE
jgi:hypothetical protein